jgi:hypothetical protein
MPTVLRGAGLRLVIWPNDHSPAHVHVFSSDGEASIALGAPGGHPRLLENRRMKRADVAKALELISGHRAMLARKWKEIHGSLD